MILKQKKIRKNIKYKRVRIINGHNKYICESYKCKYISHLGCGDDSNPICIGCRKINESGLWKTGGRYYYIYDKKKDCNIQKT